MLEVQFFKKVLFMKKVYLVLFIMLSFGLAETNAIASELSVSGDIMSRYVWRGRDYGNSVSIQPRIEYSIGDFKIGTWNAFSINADVFQELDTYISYSFLNYFSAGITNYFFPNYPSNDPSYSNNYFDYSKETTGHYVEANLGFTGTEGFPISISANVFFYGADAEKIETPNPDDPDNPIIERGDNYYSTYIELAYSNTLGEIKYNVFAGFTPNETSVYADKAGIINLGITITKEIKFSDTFSLPVHGSFITNPVQENLYVVFGFSL